MYIHITIVLLYILVLFFISIAYVAPVQTAVLARLTSEFELVAVKQGTDCAASPDFDIL